MQNGLLEEEEKDVPECSQGGVAAELAHTDYTTLQERRTTLNPALPYKQAYITRDGTENGRIVECSRGSPDINKKPHIFFYFRLSKIMVIGAYSGCWHRAKWLLTLLRPCVSLRFYFVVATFFSRLAGSGGRGPCIICDSCVYWRPRGNP